MYDNQVPTLFEIAGGADECYRLPFENKLKSIDSMSGLEGVSRREALCINAVPEVELTRHFAALAHRSYGVDDGIYPLGSCTMKYNPKINDWAVGLEGFAALHPLVPDYAAQGALELMYGLQEQLQEIAGMDRFTLQPAAGAHGELTGILTIKAWHESRGDQRRCKVLVPDSAHGTNPATANMAGYSVVEIASNKRGMVDIACLQEQVGDDTAAFMLTNPNTLGLFDENIEEIARIVHSAGGLLYYDGANLNAIAGQARPGDMGFDAMHINLHKTFATPHGGGGPGAGPVGVKSFLQDFLPATFVKKKGDRFQLAASPVTSSGMMAFHGNFGVLVRAYAYIKALGADGIREMSANAVLNARYLQHLLETDFVVPYTATCLHEFVISMAKQAKNGVQALDIAKGLLDAGMHPPTIYFPLIVPEAMMLEPTETESKARMDALAEAMIRLAKQGEQFPEELHAAPSTTPVRRVDETTAARKPILSYDLACDEQGGSR